MLRVSGRGGGEEKGGGKWRIGGGSEEKDYRAGGEGEGGVRGETFEG